MELRTHLTDRTLAYVPRWGTAPVVREKSVAEHSFYVARIARRICQVLEGKGIAVNTLKAVDMALIHDEEEAFSGDIVHTFKTEDEKLQQQIRKIAFRLFSEEYKSIPSIQGEYFTKLSKEFDDRKSMEAQIAKVADQIAGLAECEEEVNLGNKKFGEPGGPLSKYSGEIKAIPYPWFKEIKEALGF